MSILDNALQQTWKNGVKEVKLWANAAPTSQFQAQTIALDLSKYTLIRVYFCLSTELPTRKTGPSDAFVDDAGQGCAVLQSMLSRRFTADTNGVQFEIGTEQTVTTYNTSPKHMIPLSIYGIQLLGGGNTEN